MQYSAFTFVRATLGAFLLASLIAAASPAVAQKEWVVHSFPRDGSQGRPFGNLVADRAGNLYGTTYNGGEFNWGTIYELVRPVPPITGWAETVLYSFTGGADGAIPFGGLVFDDVGNLYGTAEHGGGSPECLSGCGVVFELSPPATAGSVWTESVLHSFSGAGNTDGAVPVGGLVRDAAGNLYGTTAAGSAEQNSPCPLDGCGTVFQLSPPTSPNGVWTEAILHSFGLNQENSESSLVLDSQGNLYGSTTDGGAHLKGIVYRLLRPATAGGIWSYRVLHAFGPTMAGSPEGAMPLTLTLRGKRILYGTTSVGGLHGGGTVFQLVPPTVAGGAWVENVLYSFGGGIGDGQYPRDALIFDSAGHIYGATQNGGRADAGTVFELTPPASEGGAWTETVLHIFAGGKDGASPGGGLIFGKNGVLFGVTTDGGTGDRGTVFGLLP
jgi:uncharacterized repeat protein (TIGR03803 family)